MYSFWKGTHSEDPLMSSTVQEKKQERKAAKTLSFILLVFLITWTPYNVLAVMKAILGPEHEVILETLKILESQRSIKGGGGAARGLTGLLKRDIFFR